jgi:hypothetical protein
MIILKIPRQDNLINFLAEVAKNLMIIAVCSILFLTIYYANL